MKPTDSVEIIDIKKYADCGVNHSWQTISRLPGTPFKGVTAIIRRCKHCQTKYTEYEDNE